MKTALLIVILPATCQGLRTLGEIAHPSAHYASLLTGIRGSRGTLEKAQFIVEQNMHGSATIGMLALSENRSKRFMRCSYAAETILFNPANLDTPGRQLGLGYMPHVAYSNILHALIANSDVLTPRDLMHAMVEAHKLPFGGAWLYAPVLPRFKTTDQGIIPISAHIDNYFVPLSGGDPWWMTSLVNPMATGKAEVFELLSNAGFDKTTPTPANSLIEYLCSGEPPNPEIGNWNFMMSGGFDEAGKNLTTGRLFATVLGIDTVPYEVTLVPRIWLSHENYKNVCTMRILERISKSKATRYPLSLGIHTALNSCMHLTNSLYGFGNTYQCKPLKDLYLETIDRCDKVWLTTVRHKELIDFFGEGDADFRSIPVWVAKKYVENLFDAPSLRTIRPGRSAYIENYSHCGEPHPDPNAAKFYQEAADAMMNLISDQAFNN